MTDGKLARIRWEIGQTLLPEHLVALEEALINDSVMRFKALGLPSYGIVNLSWNETLLPEGVFSIDRITMIMPSGYIFCLHDNSKLIPEKLNLMGDKKVQIHCYILEEIENSQENQEFSLNKDFKEISIKMYTMLITTDESLSDTLQKKFRSFNVIDTIKLAEFEKNINGSWKLSDGYIPPIMHVGLSPFLRESLKDLLRLLEVFKSYLKRNIGLNKPVPFQQYSVRYCLNSVSKFERVLNDMHKDVRLHPYLLYQQLQDLYSDICLYHEKMPEVNNGIYHHGALAECFNDILRSLKKQIQSRHEKYSILQFNLMDGIYSIHFPEDISRMKKIYFIIEKSKLIQETVLDFPKIGCKSRLNLLYKYVLPGINLKPAKDFPYEYLFDADVENYIIQIDEEWEYAVKENVAAFLAQPNYEGFNFYLLLQSG